MQNIEKKDFKQILKHLEGLTKSKITKKNKKNQDKQRKIKKKENHLTLGILQHL